MGKFCHIKQIASDPGHNLTHLCIIKITVRQLLQMLKGILPHICLNSGSHDMSRISHIKRRHTVNDPQTKINQGNSDNHA